MSGDLDARTEHGPLAVAIDGPSGSGKSTIGYALAQRIDATFVDTGLMYRALTLAALERGISPDDDEALGRLAKEVRIEVERPRPDQEGRRETVLLDGRDVTNEARTPRVDRAVSGVSRHAPVRRAMLRLQRREARRRDTVMVGRDIGTVVLPTRHAEGLPDGERRGAGLRGAPPRWDVRTDSSATSTRSRNGTPPTRSGRWRRCARRTMPW